MSWDKRPMSGVSPSTGTESDGIDESMSVSSQRRQRTQPSRILHPSLYSQDGQQSEIRSESVYNSVRLTCRRTTPSLIVGVDVYSFVSGPHQKSVSVFRPFTTSNLRSPQKGGLFWIIYVVVSTRQSEVCRIDLVLYS